MVTKNFSRVTQSILCYVPELSEGAIEVRVCTVTVNVQQIFMWGCLLAIT